MSPTNMTYGEMISALTAQMSADAYLVDSGGLPLFSFDSALRAGNNNLAPTVLQNGNVTPNELLRTIPDASPTSPLLPGATRFPVGLVREFTIDYGDAVVTQTPNDASGLSVTVLRSNANPSHYTVAFRSSEFPKQSFGGDRERDIDGADVDLAVHGFAWGQLASADRWFQSARAAGGVLAGAQSITLTGYSLGGHIAMVMTELHPEVISATWLFNSAGRGAVAPGVTIRQLLDAYSALLVDPDGDIAWIDAPRPSDPIADALHAAARRETANPLSGGSPDLYNSARHKWAIRVLGPYASGTLYSSTIGGGALDPVVDDKITYVYGMATHHDDTMTALSGIVPAAHRIRVFIEDQPFYYGPYPALFPTDAERLGRDFLRSHSITLIADSLALARIFQRVDATLAGESIDTIFATASNQVSRSDRNASTATAESDSLEKALDALRWAMLPEAALVGRRTTEADSGPDGFGNLDNRNTFYDRITELGQQLDRNPGTRYTITPLATMVWKGDTGLSGFLTNQTVAYVKGQPLPAQLLVTRAKEDSFAGEGYRVALENLSPFALTADRAVYDVDKVALDRFSEQYLKDRALFLTKRLEMNLDNKTTVGGAGVIPVYLEDRTTGVRIDWVRKEPDRRGADNPIYVKFGHNENPERETIEGGGSDDRLYGRGGNDLLRGLALNDHLEGNDGDDELWGGSGRDTLLGGRGDDELRGETGSDTLEGGAGIDRLFGGDDNDTLTGGADDDWLDGGRGFDTFVVGAGHDTIVDEGDGGTIRTGDGLSVSGAFEKRGDRYVLQTNEAVTAQLQGNALTVMLDAAASVRIDGFHSGDLGIQLVEVPAKGRMARGYQGDLRPVDNGDAGLLYDEWGNVVMSEVLFDGRPDVFVGSPADDVISTYGGRDAVDDAWGGNDVISVGFDDDSAGGGEGNDTVSGNAGWDVLDGGPGDDRLFGGQERQVADAIEAGHSGDLAFPEADWIDGGTGNDVIDGADGGDLLFGGLGNDLIVGGAGGDLILSDQTMSPALSVFDIAASQWHPTWAWRPVGASTFAVAVIDSDRHQHSDAALIYAADAGGDVIYAGSGDDFVAGGGGSDIVSGGAGDDVISGNDDDDTLSGDAGDDRITGDSGENLVGEYRVRQGNDVLDGGAGNDWLQGEGGDDYLAGGQGDDTLLGDGTHVGTDLQGDDTLLGGDGNDVLIGEGGRDLLDGGTGNDVLDSGAGDDLLSGGDGDDRLTGGEGDDMLVGGKGADVLRGGAGNDTYVIDERDRIDDDEGENTIRFSNGVTPDTLGMSTRLRGGAVYAVITAGGAAVLEWKVKTLVSVPGTLPSAPPLPGFVLTFDDDSQRDSREMLGAWWHEAATLSGTSADDDLDGFAGDDSLFGLAGRDVIHGYAGNDRIEGGAGADILSGGGGNDHVLGGGGGDTYVFLPGDGHDVVTPAFGDVLVLGAGVLPEDVRLVRRANGDLSIELPGTGDAIEFRGVYDAGGTKLTRIEFVDGGVVGQDELMAVSIAPVEGTAGNDVLVGSDEAETLLGLAGDDRLDGRAGNDILVGGAGADTYAMSMNMGFDSAREENSEGGTVSLGLGLSWDSIVPERDGPDLVLRLAGTSGVTRQGLRLEDYATVPGLWTLEDAAAAGARRSLIALVDEFEAAQAADPYLVLQRDFRHGLVHAHDSLARFEGLVRTGPLAYASAPFVSDFVETRVATVVDRYDAEGAVVETEVREKRSWRNYTPDKLFREERALVFESTTVTGETPIMVGGAGVAILGRSETTGMSRTSGAERRVDVSSADVRMLGDVSAAAPGEPVREISYDITYERDTRLAETAGSEVPVEVRRRVITVPAVHGDGENNVVVYTARAIVYAGAGDDIVESSPDWFATRDDLPVRAGVFVDGEAGHDQISGQALDDVLIGGAGDDQLRAGAGADLLIGGSGSDRMDGGADADRYLLRAGDQGIDIITDVSADLVVAESTAQGVLETWFAGEHPGESIPHRIYRRDDALFAASGLVAQDTVVLPAGVAFEDLDIRIGRASAAELGLSGDDLLTLSNGAIGGDPEPRPWDTLDLSWGEGDGVRLFLGDWSRPLDQSNPGDGYFTLEYAMLGGLGAGIERIEFSDGSGAGVSELRQRAQRAWRGVDVVRGQGDVLVDAEGDIEAVRFAEDIQPWEVDVTAAGDDLHLHLRDTGDGLTIRGWFGAEEPTLRRFAFADGGEWLARDIASWALMNAPTPGNDVLLGHARYRATIDAGQGDDTVLSYDGDDAIDGNAGNDWLDGGEGSDELVDRAGSNVLRGRSGDDRAVVGGERFVFEGGDGNDWVRLSGGRGVVDGGRGADEVIGSVESLLVRVRPEGGEDRLDADVEVLTLLTDRHLRLTALTLEADGRDLLIHFDDDTRLRVVDGWATERVGALRLQTVTDRIRLFNLEGVLDDLRWARAQASGLGSLVVAPDRWGAPVLESETHALGGDWAVADPLGSVAPADAVSWLRTVTSSEFGQAAQEVTQRWRNAPPVIVQNVDDQSLTEGESATLALPDDLFADPDPGDRMALSVAAADGGALPDWIRFDAEAGMFTFVPGGDDVGSQSIRVTATDGAGATASTTFHVMVDAVAGPVQWVGTSNADDIVVRSGTYDVSAGGGDDRVIGPAAAAILRGEGGDDLLVGQTKEDTLFGGAGADILMGGDGHDALRGDGGHNLLAAGGGNDWMFGQSEGDLLAGGRGDDDLRVVDGHYVVSYNRGDGQDRLTTFGSATSVLSLGGGIRPGDLELSRVGDDLQLGTGSGEGVTLVGWYSMFARHAVSRVQVIEFDDGAGAPEATLLDFAAMVDAFDADAGRSPGPSRWTLADAVARFDASGGEDGTLWGGDLAVAYAGGGFSGVAVTRALDLLHSDDFATVPQPLRGQDWLKAPSSLSL